MKGKIDDQLKFHTLALRTMSIIEDTKMSGTMILSTSLKSMLASCNASIYVYFP